MTVKKLWTVRFDFNIFVATPIRSQAAQALYQITLDVSLSYKRYRVTKIRWERNGFALKTIKILYFVNKTYLPCCCVVFFIVCQLLRPIQQDFSELSCMGRFHKSAKRTTRAEANQSTENIPADSVPSWVTIICLTGVVRIELSTAYDNGCLAPNDENNRYQSI